MLRESEIKTSHTRSLRIATVSKTTRVNIDEKGTEATEDIDTGDGRLDRKKEVLRSSRMFAECRVRQRKQNNNPTYG